MDNSRSRSVEHLGVNKIGKNIRKSPLHQPSYTGSNGGGNNDNSQSINSAASVAPGGAGAQRPQPQPQVYNVSKNDFRNIVQQLTGSPARDPLPRPASNSPKPQV
ncbi:unnamed protein product [Rhodiola kirilowii]